jgi:hypothetical protein
MGIVIGIVFFGIAVAEQLPISDFSEGLVGWTEKSFKGKTAYRVERHDGQAVLAAESHDNASGLFKKIRIDLRKYPYLNWSWRIEKRLNIQDETTKSGDDYAARIYVVIDGGLFFWRTKAINYVWANGASRGDTWDNAFAGKNARLVAVRDRQDPLSTWLTEKRNVFEDLKKEFGQEFNFIDAVAIMTDTDNSQGHAKTYYGDIFFSAK